MVFLGVDWAEEHHDVCLLDEQGKVLGRARVANSLEGVSRIHALVADHSEEPDAVVVGIETNRGLLVQALLAAGYQIYAINLWPSTATEIGIRSRERSRMRRTPKYWRIWSEPTVTITDRWQAILSKSRPSSSWRARIRP